MLLYMDGYEHQDLAARGYTVSGSTFSTSTRFNYGNCFYLQSSGGYVKRSVPAASKIIVGCAVKHDPITSSIQGNGFLNLSGDNGATLHLSLYRLPNSNTLALVRGGVTLASAVNAFSGGWQYLEISATISDTVGRVIVKMDGMVVIDFTGDTRNGGTALTLDSISFSTSTNYAGNVYFDDLYICDDQGVSNKDFLGDRRVVTLAPNAAGASTQMTPTGVANNWDNVNELPVSSTDYNSSAVVGARDLYNMTDVPSGIQNVSGVQAFAFAFKSDTGGISLTSVVSSNGSLAKSANTVLQTSTTEIKQLLETDPNGAVAWTPAAVNAVQVGAEVA